MTTEKVIDDPPLVDLRDGDTAPVKTVKSVNTAVVAPAPLLTDIWHEILVPTRAGRSVVHASTEAVVGDP